MVTLNTLRDYLASGVSVDRYPCFASLVPINKDLCKRYRVAEKTGKEERWLRVYQCLSVFPCVSQCPDAKGINQKADAVSILLWQHLDDVASVKFVEPDIQLLIEQFHE